MLLCAGCHKEVSIADNLQSKAKVSESISDICVMCWRAKESIYHLFMHCEVPSFIWCYFTSRLGLACAFSLLFRSLFSIGVGGLSMVVVLFFGESFLLQFYG